MKTAVLISGRGSNLQALIDAQAESGWPAEIVLVISNEPGAKGLERAEAAGIATAVINHRDFDGREPFDSAMTEAIEASAAAFVCLAGFMRLLTASFVDRWHDRLINIHPSLLPSYKGLDSHRRVLADGVRLTGCTVHFVRPAMDAGPIIAQDVIAVSHRDSVAQLARRGADVERTVLARAVQGHCQDRVIVHGNTTVVF